MNLAAPQDNVGRQDAAESAVPSHYRFLRSVISSDKFEVDFDTSGQQR